ncbi:MAG TPA: hypothetical protein VJV79_24580 [Polyangiaceae bacterium]|nr:hypothetical protein [Polyangiaceae bacterium]
MLERWSKNGFFVELVVPEPGLWVWEGKIASQIDSDLTVTSNTGVAVANPTSGQYLPGGETQLLINFKAPAHAAAQKAVHNLPRKPTNWTGPLGIDVPDRSVTVQHLGEFEIVPKRTGTAAATAARGAQAADTESSP